MSISLEEFTELANYIKENHGFKCFKEGSKHIKYIRCSFDTRFGDIFGVSLDDHHFVKVNENRKRDLKKWIYCWLKNEDDGFDPIRDDPEIDWKNLLKNKGKTCQKT